MKDSIENLYTFSYHDKEFNITKISQIISNKRKSAKSEILKHFKTFYQNKNINYKHNDFTFMKVEKMKDITIKSDVDSLFLSNIDIVCKNPYYESENYIRKYGRIKKLTFQKPMIYKCKLGMFKKGIIVSKTNSYVYLINDELVSEVGFCSIKYLEELVKNNVKHGEYDKLFKIEKIMKSGKKII